MTRAQKPKSDSFTYVKEEKGERREGDERGKTIIIHDITMM